MNKKFPIWFVNCITGTFMVFGLCEFIHIIASLLTDGIFNRNLSLFLFLVILIGWCCSFIYHFASKLLVKALLHSIVWFMLGAICYMSVFDSAIGMKSLLIVIVLYGILYFVFLTIINMISKKINTPFRHFNDFMAKITQFISK